MLSQQKAKFVRKVYEVPCLFQLKQIKQRSRNNKYRGRQYFSDRLTSN